MISRPRSASTFGGARCGFSLTELLVVMGVLILVLAIVVPTFSRSTSLANRAVCAGNLRNLSVGFATLQSEMKMRADIIQGSLGSSWAGLIYPYIGFSVEALVCPEDDPRNSPSLPRFTKRYWGSIEWDFFAMDNSLPPFEGISPPWNVADYVQYWNQGAVPTLWKLNEDDYVTWMQNSNAGWGVMHDNKDWLPRYTPGGNPERYWVVFEDEGGLWTSADGGGHDYRDYSVHIVERARYTYDITFYEYGSSDANHGVISDHGMEMWLEEGSGDRAGVGPFYFADPPTNYGKNKYDPPRGGHQILLLDYELLVCDPDAEPDSDEAFEKNVAPRHLGKCNVLYADQSVQVQSPEEITPRDATVYELYWKYPP